MPKLSIIIPAYNEEQRLPATLSSVCTFFTNQNLDYEVVVVDDGSTDRTAQTVGRHTALFPQIRLVSYPANRGKGFAVKTGVLAATGDLILINDADGSSPIEEFTRLNAAIADGAQIAIGSRAKPDPSCQVKALPYRKYIGNIFNSIIQSLILPGIFDTQCGFKLFRKAAAKNLFSQSIIDGYAFDVEILYLARKNNYRVDEISINWANCDGSKVNVWLDSPKMLFEVLKIKSNYRSGREGKNSLEHLDE